MEALHASGTGILATHLTCSLATLPSRLSLTPLRLHAARSAPAGSRLPAHAALLHHRRRCAGAGAGCLGTRGITPSAHLSPRILRGPLQHSWRCLRAATPAGISQRCCAARKRTASLTKNLLSHAAAHCLPLSPISASIASLTTCLLFMPPQHCLPSHLSSCHICIVVVVWFTARAWRTRHGHAAHGLFLQPTNQPLALSMPPACRKERRGWPTFKPLFSYKSYLSVIIPLQPLCLRDMVYILARGGAFARRAGMARMAQQDSLTGGLRDTTAPLSLSTQNSPAAPPLQRGVTPSCGCISRACAPTGDTSLWNMEHGEGAFGRDTRRVRALLLYLFLISFLRAVLSVAAAWIARARTARERTTWRRLRSMALRSGRDANRGIIAVPHRFLSLCRKPYGANAAAPRARRGRHISRHRWISHLLFYHHLYSSRTVTGSLSIRRCIALQRRT